MPATPFDSALYGPLLGDDEAARLFTDTAELRALALVEAALARAQAAAGLIPETAARAIDRAAHEAPLDAAEIGPAVAADGIPVPGFLAAFRAALAPEHARHLHFGATTQDIMDTGLMLRLRRALELVEARLLRAARALGALAGAHADLPMAARTWGQAAVPTSFGAVAAGWGAPLLAQRSALDALRAHALAVQLGGAAGTLAAMGPEGPTVRRRMAEALELADPGTPWHAERGRIGAVAGWCAGLAAGLAKMGEDLMILTRSDIAEVVLASGGGSSTMPQKRNPVQPATMVALARHAMALEGMLRSAAGAAREARDGAAWMGEWLALPQMLIATARATALAADLAETLAPVPARMGDNLHGPLGLIHAEAIAFALAREMPRPDAEAAVKALARRAEATRRPLPALAAEAHPGLDITALTDPARRLGEAPDLARRFATAAAAL